MRLYLEDWRYTPAGDGTKEFVPPNSLASSCSSWVTFSPSEFSLPPFGKQRVSYSISAPEKASGEFFSVLFFENTAGEQEIQEGKVGAGLTVAVRIATLFYVDIQGTVNRSAELGALKAQKNDQGYTFEIPVHNTGNGDITAGGTYHIMDRDGVVAARGELVPSYTFGGDTANMKALWKDAIPPGHYTFVTTTDLGMGLKETGSGKAPVLVKEADVDVDANGEITGIGVFK